MKALLILTSSIFVSSSFGYEARMRVVDDEGAPVKGAAVIVSFVGVRPDQSNSHRGTTGPDGIFSASGKSLIEVYMEAKKDGHYAARLDGLSPTRDHDQLMVLPRQLRPVPLYANRFSPGSGSGLTIPVQNTWLGYDFEVGDWVQPHGKGKVTDIRFRFRNEFKGWKSNEKAMETNRRINRGASEEEIRNFYGKWDAELEISFPGEAEGLFEETRFLAYSRLKLPHSAPVEGYVPTWRYTANSYTPRTARENVGFFLRTRVRLDANGKIVSANYAKVVGDFYLVPQGSLMFSYYFNPVPNDRNLEFDPKRNLFPANFPGANVGDP
jgi:hypothetical protein